MSFHKRSSKRASESLNDSGESAPKIAKVTVTQKASVAPKIAKASAASKRTRASALPAANAPTNDSVRGGGRTTRSGKAYGGGSAPKMPKISSPEPMFEPMNGTSTSEPVEIASTCLIREDGGGQSRFRKKQRSHPVERIETE